ncbi:restriction endonuclease [Streptomyces sp. H39-C1]|uniref:restriction endonuclease n=1 Tax=Streptomyces sp. H39-C1 TaxID=3004355 RepID=UPI0022B06496|nr:restriction endonuclease [Streptomyces sp. H39-C1]MCZ4102559.1 restriction endonuclease [Streptomyces sp. H39-C1]
MTGSLPQFGENAMVPSRAFALGWPQYTQERWARFLAAYRERVGAVYEDLADQHPATFTLLRPLDLLIVVSMVGEWAFIRPARVDTVTLRERWEHPQLAQWDMVRRADHERIVRDIEGVSNDFDLYEVIEHGQRLFDLTAAPNVASANAEYFGRELADLHAADALRQPELQKALAALTGRSIDEAALRSLRDRLEEIRVLKGAPRGKRFETWLGELLAAHGCDVEPGTTKDGEQIDFFVHKPFRAVIECRWKGSRLQPRELADLTAKLGRRPAVVAGIYVSMSGFTDACRGHAAREPNGRTVLLWEKGDVDKLLGGQIHALDLFDDHVSDRVRRYRRESP